MIKGIGLDMCSISRVQSILDREGPDGAFFRRAFSDAEREEASLRHDLAAFYAARFAVKEAVFKAVAPLTEKGFDLRIVDADRGERPPSRRQPGRPGHGKACALPEGSRHWDAASFHHHGG